MRDLLNEIIRFIENILGCILTLILFIFVMAVLLPIGAVAIAILCIIGICSIIKWYYIEYITKITLFNKHKS